MSRVIPISASRLVSIFTLPRTERLQINMRGPLRMRLTDMDLWDQQDMVEARRPTVTESKKVGILGNVWVCPASKETESYLPYNIKSMTVARVCLTKDARFSVRDATRAGGLRVVEAQALSMAFCTERAMEQPCK